VGIVKKSQMLDGSQVQCGDCLGLASQESTAMVLVCGKIVDGGFNWSDRLELSGSKA